MVMSSSYIQNTKNQFNIVKIIKDSQNNTQKIGLSIYKRTLELNIINQDNIDLFLNSNFDFIESKVNLGFISICNVPCFLFASNEDIKEKGKMHGKQKFKVYKIKNIQYIPLVTYLTNKVKSSINNEFDRIKKFINGEGIFFCDDPFRFDIDIKGQIEYFQDINIKYKLFENFQYNHDFSPYECQKINTPIVKGFFKTIHYVNNSKEKGDINIAMRYKMYESSKYLIEIEIFIPPTQNNPKFFQTIFYAYFNDFDDKVFVLKNLIDSWNQNNFAFKHKENIEKLGLIINFNKNNKNDSIFKEIENISNFEIINLGVIKNIESAMYKFIESFKSIGYNYKYNNIEYNSQNKLLLLVSDDYQNLLSMIKIVSSLLFSLFLKDRNYKENIINNIKDDIFKEFKKLEKKIKKFTKEFPKRIELNKMNDSNFEIIKKSYSQKKESIFSELEPELNFDINQIEQCNINENSIKLFIGTYNVNALDSNSIKNVDLSPFLFPEKLGYYFSENDYPLFYCIGLEETIELNPKNILMKPTNKAEIWEERISLELQKKYNYYLICQEQLVGILLLFYVKSSEIKYMRNTKIGKLKSGFMGCGNKGCCFLNFEYKGKRFGFCSCHLPAGQKEKHLISRKDTFNQILDYKISNNENEFRKNDYYFIFGDLNFRTEKIGLINLKNHIKCLSANKKAEEESLSLRNSLIGQGKPKTKIMKRLKTEVNFEKKVVDNYSDNYFKSSKTKIKKSSQNNYFGKSKIELNNNEEIKENLMDENIFTKVFFNEFLANEELKNFEKTELVQFNIEEAEIKFPPTYKYKKNTNSYNISKRVPSWTDRILYKNKENIKSILYDRIDMDLSDHKPIVGFFEINKFNED